MMNAAGRKDISSAELAVLQARRQAGFSGAQHPYRCIQKVCQFSQRTCGVHSARCPARHGQTQVQRTCSGLYLLLGVCGVVSCAWSAVTFPPLDSTCTHRGGRPSDRSSNCLKSEQQLPLPASHA